MLVFLCLLISGVISSCIPQGEKRDCVVIIGDSIFALYDNVVPNLENLSGQKYRRYDVTGSEMQGGLIPSTNIVDQFKKALRQGKIRTLIMDGGGNDFIISGTFTNARAQVSRAYTEIFDLAAASGVENVVVMGYYATASTTAATNQSEEDIKALTLGYARDLGLNTAHFDPSEDPWFANKRPVQYIHPTDIFRVHPTAAAGKRLAELIWSTMQGTNPITPFDYEPMEQGEDCEAF